MLASPTIFFLRQASTSTLRTTSAQTSLSSDYLQNKVWALGLASGCSHRWFPIQLPQAYLNPQRSLTPQLDAWYSQGPKLSYSLLPPQLCFFNSCLVAHPFSTVSVSNLPPRHRTICLPPPASKSPQKKIMTSSFEITELPDSDVKSMSNLQIILRSLVSLVSFRFPTTYLQVEKSKPESDFSKVTQLIRGQNQC